MRFLQDNPAFNQGQYENTPLMLAAGDVDVITVEALLREGTEVSAQDVFGRAALHMVSDFGYDDVPNALKVVSLLVEAGAEINVQDKSGVTPLMLATYRGSKEVVLLLLEHGANPKLKRDDGSTARSAMEGSPSIKRRRRRVIKLLEQYGG